MEIKLLIGNEEEDYQELGTEKMFVYDFQHFAAGLLV